MVDETLLTRPRVFMKLKTRLNMILTVSVGLALLAGAGFGMLAPAQESYDLIIANGRIVDGTGNPWFYGDVGVRGDRVARIADLHNAQARRRIDAAGLIVAPGFIDMLGQSELPLLIDPRAESKLFQGITTEVTGEGGSAAPLNEYIIKQME